MSFNITPSTVPAVPQYNTINTPFDDESVSEGHSLNGSVGTQSITTSASSSYYTGSSISAESDTGGTLIDGSFHRSRRRHHRRPLYFVNHSQRAPTGFETEASRAFDRIRQTRSDDESEGSRGGSPTMLAGFGVQQTTTHGTMGRGVIGNTFGVPIGAITDELMCGLTDLDIADINAHVPCYPKTFGDATVEFPSSNAFTDGMDTEHLYDTTVNGGDDLEDSTSDAMSTGPMRFLFAVLSEEETAPYSFGGRRAISNPFTNRRGLGRLPPRNVRQREEREREDRNVVIVGERAERTTMAEEELRDRGVISEEMQAVDGPANHANSEGQAAVAFSASAIHAVDDEEKQTQPATSDSDARKKTNQYQLFLRNDVEEEADGADAANSSYNQSFGGRSLGQSMIAAVCRANNALNYIHSNRVYENLPALGSTQGLHNPGAFVAPTRKETVPLPKYVENNLVSDCNLGSVSPAEQPLCDVSSTSTAVRSSRSRRVSGCPTGHAISACSARTGHTLLRPPQFLPISPIGTWPRADASEDAEVAKRVPTFKDRVKNEESSSPRASPLDTPCPVSLLTRNLPIFEDVDVFRCTQSEGRNRPLARSPPAPYRSALHRDSRHPKATPEDYLYVRSEARPNARVSFCKRVAVVTSSAVASILTRDAPSPATTRGLRFGEVPLLPTPGSRDSILATLDGDSDVSQMDGVNDVSPFLACTYNRHLQLGPTLRPLLVDTLLAQYLREDQADYDASRQASIPPNADDTKQHALSLHADAMDPYNLSETTNSMAEGLQQLARTPPDTSRAATAMSHNSVDTSPRGRESVSASSAVTHDVLLKTGTILLSQMDSSCNESSRPQANSQPSPGLGPRLVSTSCMRASTAQRRGAKGDSQQGLSGVYKDIHPSRANLLARLAIEREDDEKAGWTPEHHESEAWVAMRFPEGGSVHDVSGQSTGSAPVASLLGASRPPAGRHSKSDASSHSTQSPLGYYSAGRLGDDVGSLSHSLGRWERSIGSAAEGPWPAPGVTTPGAGATELQTLATTDNAFQQEKVVYNGSACSIDSVMDETLHRHTPIVDTDLRELKSAKRKALIREKRVARKAVELANNSELGMGATRLGGATKFGPSKSMASHRSASQPSTHSLTMARASSTSITPVHATQEQLEIQTSSFQAPAVGSYSDGSLHFSFYRQPSASPLSGALQTQLSGLFCIMGGRQHSSCVEASIQSPQRQVAGGVPILVETVQIFSTPLKTIPAGNQSHRSRNDTESLPLFSIATPPANCIPSPTLLGSDGGSLLKATSVEVISGSPRHWVPLSNASDTVPQQVPTGLIPLHLSKSSPTQTRRRRAASVVIQEEAPTETSDLTPREGPAVSPPLSFLERAPSSVRNSATPVASASTPKGVENGRDDGALWPSPFANVDPRTCEGVVEIPLYDPPVYSAHLEQTAKPRTQRNTDFDTHLAESVCGYEEKYETVSPTRPAQGSFSEATNSAGVRLRSLNYAFSVRRGFYMQTALAVRAAMEAHLIRVLGVARMDSDGNVVDVVKPPEDDEECCNEVAGLLSPVGCGGTRLTSPRFPDHYQSPLGDTARSLAQSALCLSGSANTNAYYTSPTPNHLSGPFASLLGWEPGEADVRPPTENSATFHPALDVALGDFPDYIQLTPQGDTTAVPLRREAHESSSPPSSKHLPDEFGSLRKLNLSFPPLPEGADDGFTCQRRADPLTSPPGTPHTHGSPSDEGLPVVLPFRCRHTFPRSPKPERSTAANSFISPQCTTSSIPVSFSLHSGGDQRGTSNHYRVLFEVTVGGASACANASMAGAASVSDASVFNS